MLGAIPEHMQWRLPCECADLGVWQVSVAISAVASHYVFRRVCNCVHTIRRLEIRTSTYYCFFRFGFVFLLLFPFLFFVSKVETPDPTLTVSKKGMCRQM